MLGKPPPSRSIVSGNMGMNMSLSELISMILEPIANEWEHGFEVNSTGDFLSRIDSLNKKEDQIPTGRNQDEDTDNTHGMKNMNDESVPTGGKPGEGDEDTPEKILDDHTNGQVPQGWNKADIRGYGKLGEKTNEKSEPTEYEDKEPMNRIGRMRMMREKLRLSRKKSNLQPVSEEMKIKTLQMRAKTIHGEKIIDASRLENKKV